jgi:HAD superfamily hydrolase (TIGR01509 family)
MFKAAVFDLDGTLLDTEKFCIQAWRGALEPFGVSLTKEDYLDYVGKTRTVIAPALVKRFNLDTGPEPLLKKRAEIVYEFLKTEPIKLMPHAEEAVKHFTERGVPIALATGSSMDETTIKLNSTGLNRFFKTIVTRSDIENGKPHPETYERAIKLLGVRPEDCVAFEDTVPGTESAKSAGLNCVAIPNEFTIKQDFSHVNFVAKDLKEAIEWIKKQ